MQLARAQRKGFVDWTEQEKKRTTDRQVTPCKYCILRCEHLRLNCPPVHHPSECTRCRNYQKICRFLFGSVLSTWFLADDCVPWVSLFLKRRRRCDGCRKRWRVGSTDDGGAEHKTAVSRTFMNDDNQGGTWEDAGDKLGKGNKTNRRCMVAWQRNCNKIRAHNL